jgi:hypothetical protein
MSRAAIRPHLPQRWLLMRRPTHPRRRRPSGPRQFRMPFLHRRRRRPRASIHRPSKPRPRRVACSGRSWRRTTRQWDSLAPRVGPPLPAVRKVPRPQKLHRRRRRLRHHLHPHCPHRRCLHPQRRRQQRQPRRRPRHPRRRCLRPLQLRPPQDCRRMRRRSRLVGACTPRVVLNAC